MFVQWRMGVYFAVPAFIYALYNTLFFLNLQVCKAVRLLLLYTNVRYLVVCLVTQYFDPVSYRVLINIRILWSGLLFQVCGKTYSV